MPNRQSRPVPPGPPLPLAGWADRQLATLARLARAPAIARLNGTVLLGERAALAGFKVPLRRSAGGGCTLFPTKDGWLALNLSRSEDRELLPALLMADDLVPGSDANIARRIALHPSSWLVERGRLLGLAISAHDEGAAHPGLTLLAEGPARPRAASRRPLVLDLSALWAGPLAGHLFWLAGAEVVKVESRRRPDSMRHGDPALFAVLNQGKASVALDLSGKNGREALGQLISRADVVIEAARPRALRQMGIVAEDWLAQRPGLVWLTITGHGASGDAADWIGFGDDAAVAGGLTAALLETTGIAGFVGDAPADPLTGIAAALAGWQAWQSGRGCRIGLSMSGVVADALHEEGESDPARLGHDLLEWAGATGAPFPALPPRPVAAEVRALGADNTRLLDWTSPC